MRPIATPATGFTNGTPASSMAKEQPQTEAIDDEPQLSVMSDSALMAYGKSFMEGMAGISALSARLPPTSRLFTSYPAYFTDG